MVVHVKYDIITYVKQKFDLLNKFSIGDLVRLNEDQELDIGYGLVTEVRDTFDDVYDLVELSRKLEEIRNSLYYKDDGFYPTKPQILVLWNSIKETRNNKQLWMYASELTIVQKVTVS